MGGVAGATGVLFAIGESKNFAFFKLENFQKMLKNHRKIIIFGKVVKTRSNRRWGWNLRLGDYGLDYTDPSGTARQWKEMA